MTTWGPPLKHGACVAALAVIAALGGCWRSEDAATSAGASRVVIRDDAEFHVEVDRVTMSSADRLHMRLVAISPRGGHVELPLIGDSVGEFTVVEASPQRTTAEAAGRVRREQDLVLEPFLPGEYHIPALAFAMMRSGGDATIVEAPEIAIDVTTALGAEPPEAGLAPWLDIVEPEANPRTWVWATGAAGVVVVATAVGVVFWQRRRHRAVPRDDAIAGAKRTLQRVLEADIATPADAANAMNVCVQSLRDAAAAKGASGAEAMTLAQLVQHLATAGLLNNAVRARLANVTPRVERVQFGNEHADAMFAQQFAQACLDAVDHMAVASATFAARAGEARAA